MVQPALEVADIFRVHGAAWRAALRGHLSLGQLKVMSAIEQCRSAALGGHVLRCGGCGADQVAYNSCRNRHCPKCQSSAAQRWLDARQADLLPVEYFHGVFTLPAPIADIAYQNKAVVYGLLFDVAAEVLLTIAADPKHLGARIGATLVLHTWGSALTHHPHVHAVVPGGGLAPDGKTWVACRPGLFLSVRVLSRLFRRRFLEELLRMHQADKLQFFGEHAALADAKAFKAWLALLRKCEWVVYARAPVRRAAGGAGLPVALHAPGSDFQQPLARDGQARGNVPLEGLPRQGIDPLQGHDPDARRVHAPLPAACATGRLPPHSTLRAAGKRQPQGQPGAGARVVERTQASAVGQRPRRHEDQAADLRLSPLRSRTAHRADLHTRPLDSCTTTARPMNAAFDTPRLCRHCSLEPPARRCCVAGGHHGDHWPANSIQDPAHARMRCLDRRRQPAATLTYQQRCRIHRLRHTQSP